MNVIRLRRLCAVFVALAFLLPLVPAAVGSPLMFGGHCGNAPLYGEGECLSISIGFMIVAAVGTALTQRGLPFAARRKTAPLVLAFAVLYVIVLPAVLQSR